MEAITARSETFPAPHSPLWTIRNRHDLLLCGIQRHRLLQVREEALPRDTDHEASLLMLLSRSLRDGGDGEILGSIDIDKSNK